MQQSDRQALRALLTVIYQSVDYTSAAGMEGLTAEILRETRLVSSTTSFEWNSRRSILRFPPELLGICFSYLSLSGRLAASHVSQAWRAAAIGNPSLWADIQHVRGDARLSAQLLLLFISRARALPIRLDVGVHVTGVVEVLRDHVHLMEFVNAKADLDRCYLANPSPLLHTLRLAGKMLITDTFLGGKVGKLAELHADGLRVLRPARALATLTTVSVGGCGTISLHFLFASCPALQSLSVTQIVSDGEDSPWCPPRTLTHLELATNHGDLDVAPLFLACDAVASLQRVLLQPGPLVDQLPIALMVQGALTLDVRLGVDEAVTVLAKLAGDRHHTLVLPTLIRRYRAQREARTFPPVFDQDGAAFAQLRYIALPLVVLATSVADAPVLPALRTLHIRVAERQITHPTSATKWELLAHLAAVPPCHVVLALPRLPQLAARDAQSIVTALAPVARHLQVTVRGFAPGIVSVPPDLEIQFV